jgi:carboxylesterase type B
VASDGSPLPVLVWIHGGSNANGSNSQLGHLQPMDDFSREGLVCVSLNYRLGIHGFLHLPTQGVTNLAIRDLCAGLRWVRDEIGSFGGDPANVTVWGESAGAVNIATLLSSPAAQELFHKAILMSGAPAQWATQEEYASTGLADMTAALVKAAPGLRVTSEDEPLLADLEQLSPEVLSMASGQVKDSMQSVRGLATLPATFNALPDGEVVPWNPHAPPCGEPTGGAVMGAVPLMVGSNVNEMTDFADFIGYSMLGRLGRALAGFAIRRRLLMAPEPLMRLAAGRLTRSGLSDADARVACDLLIDRLGGDIGAAVNVLATHPEREMALAHSAHAPVFEFELHLTAEESPVIGSGHGTDFALLFQPRAPGMHGPIFTAEEKAGACRAFWGRDALGDDLQAVADRLRTAIVNFATAGSPMHFGGVPWRVAHGAEGDVSWRLQPEGAEDGPAHWHLVKGAQGDGGQMIVSTAAHFEEWGGEDSGGKRRHVLRQALKELRAIS